MVRSDYLVIGAGATALAFVDSVFHQTEATFTIVDRRDLPGGHWNDAYPFVRLHQPARMYGVASLPFGDIGIEQVGSNRGLAPLASGAQVSGHFHEFVYETLLQSGRVTYLPLTEYRGDGECVSLLSGEVTRVSAPVTVDATLMEATIPLTHQRSFEVAPGAACVAPNSLSRVAAGYRHFAVLGAGKTALDVVNWLLGNGVAHGQVTWVRPRDAWLYNREFCQPGPHFMAETARLQSAQYEAIATATSLEDLGPRLEAAEMWFRIDHDVLPSMFHGATVSRAELEQARLVRDVVRGSHVKAVEPDQLVLEGGDHPLPPGTLTIDCTASGLGNNVGVVQPVFSTGRIALQMLRQYQPTFSSALIGHIEVNVPDEAARAAMTNVASMTDTVADWVAGVATTMRNQAAWLGEPAVRDWLATCRLDLTSSWNDPAVTPEALTATVGQLRSYIPAAMQNIPRLLAR